MTTGELLEPIPLDEPLPGGAVAPKEPRFRTEKPALLDVVRTVALVVIAVALLLIAVDERRQTAIAQREDCMSRVGIFRGGVGGGRDFEQQVREACGLEDPLADR